MQVEEEIQGDGLLFCMDKKVNFMQKTEGEKCTRICKEEDIQNLKLSVTRAKQLFMCVENLCFLFYAHYLFFCHCVFV